ncbi:MAG: YwbE family protein [Bacteroidota bacterium]
MAIVVHFPVLHFIKKSLLCKMTGQNRSDIKVGIEVGIVKKENQISSIITEGIIKEILTRSNYHPHGIKVRLTSGEVGRVKIVKQL